MRWTALVLLCSFAAPAAAQPIVLTAEARGGAEPDTTAPWRYFPLAVGNAWEYYNYFTGERRRVDVYGTETYGDRTYFSTAGYVYDANGENPEIDFGRPIRYDTTRAAVWIYVEETGGEFPYGDASCPLSADFGSEVECYFGETFAVGGGYDGLLAFGEPLPGTGPDTVRTAVKTYLFDDTGVYYDYRYAAGIGLVFYEGIIVREGLYYARVDGVEYGVSVLPPFTVSAEDEVGGEAATFELGVPYPNPARSVVTLPVAMSTTAEVQVVVYDVLGRVVERRDLGTVPVGQQAIVLNVEPWPAGTYVVRLMAGDATVSQIVMRLR